MPLIVKKLMSRNEGTRRLPDMARLYANENVPLPTVTALRDRGMMC